MPSKTNLSLKIALTLPTLVVLYVALVSGRYSAITEDINKHLRTASKEDTSIAHLIKNFFLYFCTLNVSDFGKATNYFGGI